MAGDDQTPGRLPAFFLDPNVRFPAKPCLVTDLNVFQMPRGLGFQFRGGPTSFAVRGKESERALAFLLPKLDGTNTVANLVNQSPPDLPPETILRCLRLLHMKGVIAQARVEDRSADGRPLAPDLAGATRHRELLFWGRKLGITGYLAGAQDAVDRLYSAKLLLVGTGLFGSVTHDLLTRSGCGGVQTISWDDDGFLQTVVAGEESVYDPSVHLSTKSIGAVVSWIDDLAGDANLVVLATRNAPDELVRAINRSCLDAGCPYIRADDDGVEFQLGPYVVPHGSACFTCMELRESSVREFMLEEALFQEALAAEGPSGETRPLGESIPTATFGASLLVMEVVRVITGIAAPSFLNAVFSVSALDGSIRSNRILRVPRCPDCSRSPSQSLSIAT
jgi:bacteriocin biosynthesis cyclodehydratase domain-containing protein